VIVIVLDGSFNNDDDSVWMEVSTMMMIVIGSIICWILRAEFCIIYTTTHTFVMRFQ